ncbi:class I SAM-dependent methyltransferase [Deinococcus aestuarii]|uniref:class I SAM-dependent methyltransferase n=1 Tax=Deinococcus aestuarii TaxID=2774531 RepID=UPI001C0E4EAE|nr:class I SAM-dependent methyltransferase [Deinococcus aestuarii]
MTEYRDPEYARAYLAAQDAVPQRGVGERLLLDLLPVHTRRVLDLGCGDGRLLALVRSRFEQAEGVALDASEAMLEAARARFAGQVGVTAAHHDLNDPLPDLGTFDAVVSGFAIHHLPDERKRTLYREVRARLAPGGVFLNLEHVASVNEREHARFLALLGGKEDQSNRLAPAWTQVEWLREVGFMQADVAWKWLELVLLVGWVD